MTVLNVRVLSCHSDDQHMFRGEADEYVLIVRGTSRGICVDRPRDTIALLRSIQSSSHLQTVLYLLHVLCKLVDVVILPSLSEDNSAISRVNI